MIGRLLSGRSKPPATPCRAGQENVRVSSDELLALHRHARQIGLQAGNIQAQQAGNYLSKFKGRGMEFAEVRPYLPGDDLRSIDWRVTARSGKVHTKLFREEREKPVLIWVDYRRPMFFATRGAFKSVVAARAAALLAWSAITRGDRLGGLVFNEQRHLEMRPLQGKSAVLHFIRNLVEHPAWDREQKRHQDGPSQWDLAKLRHGTRPGSSIYLISDFRNLAPDALKNIGHLAKHNDMTLVFIYDSLERDLPPDGQYKISSGEQELLLDTADRQLRQNYSDSFQRRYQQLNKLCRQHRMTLLPCSTTDDPVSCLRSGLRRAVR